MNSVKTQMLALVVGATNPVGVILGMGVAHVLPTYLGVITWCLVAVVTARMYLKWMDSE
jgi:putative Ca2+/H+ antiporter (TMEM165/GDT1 family)